MTLRFSELYRFFYWSFTFFLIHPIQARSWPLQGLLDRPLDISRDGHLIDFIIDETVSVISIYYAVVVLALIWFIIAYRSRRSRRRGFYFHGNNIPTYIIQIFVGFLVFITIDLKLERLSLDHLEQTYYNYPPQEEALRIEVMPQQWAWNIRYAGSDGLFNTSDDIVTLNEMKIPRNKPVIVQLKAKDVIHSLFLPNVRLKQDAIPGTVTQFWFECTKVGEYEMVCAEHCGVNHYKMRGDFTVLEPEQFDLWLQQAQRISEIGFDPEDLDALWGWEWEES
jgi:cytochrome c oxidase subunit 2